MNGALGVAGEPLRLCDRPDASETQVHLITGRFVGVDLILPSPDPRARTLSLVDFAEQLVGQIPPEVELGRCNVTLDPDEHRAFIGSVLRSRNNVLLTYIKNLPGEPYIVRKPIPVKIEQTDEDDHTASFEEANLAISGSTEQEAFQNLILEILNAFEDFCGEEQALGLEPSRQLVIFRQYLVRQR